MELPLYQEVMLLALRNRQGTFATGFVEPLLGGAILSELLLEGRIRIAQDKSHLVEVVDASPMEDGILDEALDAIVRAKRRASLKTWITRAGHLPRLRLRVVGDLVERGILRETEDTVLLVFKRKRYPEIDPKPEQEILGRLEAVIFHGAPLTDERTAMLLALAHGAHLLFDIMGTKAIKAKVKHIESLIQCEEIGQATRETIQALQAAVTMAILIPILIS
ncbi:MAG: GPP34 family phosphoprotein [Planctomycetes bacterium]|nr:GPP34 family phosphoprotein [Planctomycetota bacterium]